MAALTMVPASVAISMSPEGGAVTANQMSAPMGAPQPGCGTPELLSPWVE